MMTASVAPSIAQLRNACQGTPPLDARLEPWMQQLLLARGENPSQVDSPADAAALPTVSHLLDRWGSPVNVLRTEPFVRNIEALRDVARDRHLDFQVFFARKANKSTAFVHAADEIGAGVDTASEVELTQVLDAGVASERMICTAAVKDIALIARCISAGVTIAIDNADEYQRIEAVARTAQRTARVALRISGFQHDGQKLFSRFGVDIDQAADVVAALWAQPDAHLVRLGGVHFHLDGYDAGQRVTAIDASLKLIDQLRTAGHPIEFLDMGGGFPMCYLESGEQWTAFWQQHAEALRKERDEVTFQNHALGLHVHEGQVNGSPGLYPYWQSLVGPRWLGTVLDAPADQGNIAQAVRRRQLQLRCEPGRSILDGCGVTLARVEYRKRHPDGFWLIGLSMNRTQCRTTSADFLVDPLLVAGPAQRDERTEPGEGYLVGAYCMESELILLRKMRFNQGVGVGDTFVFPNTAGYLMHFLESRSHQFPLAENVLWDG
ncbi:Y4yA family PLP-dependent enzyme [Roseimaritima sediminicola]|uniref:Y4yA family PLP-dependent enzyme n=1 Tax=Roseimaritima sediminicola TaxID=2662066 RepID=UPI001F2ECADE|nr:Y4yA family PLP-dependent enzyme [Roseimaritima sediminicola]